MSWWNLPNALTLARVAMIPVVVAMMHYDTRSSSIWAAILFIVAGITDVVDGYLARRYKVTSTLGAFLDPLADKLLVMAVLVMLVPLGRIPAWVVIVLLGRELSITGLRGIASAEGMIIKASILGKFKTAYQMTGLSFLLFHYPILGVDCHVVGTWLILIATGLSLYSAVDYVLAFIRYHRQHAAAPGSA